MNKYILTQIAYSFFDKVVVNTIKNQDIFEEKKLSIFFKLVICQP